MSRKIHPAVVGAQPFQVATREGVASPMFESGEGAERLEMALSRYPTKQAALLPLLHFVQEKKGWIAPADMEEVAAALDLTPAYVHSIATFYTMYNKHPVGRYLDPGVHEHLLPPEQGRRGAATASSSEAGTARERRSEDGLFTVLEAECLGACGFATVVQINDGTSRT